MALPAKKPTRTPAPAAEPKTKLSVVPSRTAPKPGRATAAKPAQATAAKPARSTAAKTTRLKVVETPEPENQLLAWAMTALEDSRANTFLCDPDWTILYANKKSFEILEIMEPNLHKWSDDWKSFRAAEVVGTSLDFLFTDEPLEFRKASDTRNHPYRGIIKTGPCVCDVQVTSITDEQGELVGYAVDWERITDKIAQEKRVQQLMNVLEESSANTLLCDLNWTVLYANKKSFEILEFMQPNLHRHDPRWHSFRARDIVGKSLDWLFTDEPEEFRKASDTRSHPYRKNIKTGPCVCDVIVTSTRDDKGEVTGYAVYWERITEKLAMEKQIQAQVEEGKYLAAKIEEMMAATQAIAAGDLTQKIPIEKEDSIGMLATAFNTMTDALSVMAGAADKIASGDLTVTVKPQSDKDVLGNAFAKMITNLSQLVAQSRAAAENILQASTEIAAGTEDLSQRTGEQASSLEETAASMEEMTSTVKQNADNARQANQLAAQAREVAEKGGSVVGNAVTSMEEINQASRRIADIISVIDEIAFQTNLLALNAAVEAARVGEQGRGFAVVAAEVRNLAGRSATAAKEIKALVQDSVQKVQEGSSLVNQSGHQLEEIVNSVKKVADIISEISAASQEQSAGIEQVNKAIMQMDQITQQNAALVEEAAASSQSMTQQATDLRDVVNQFQLDPSYLAAIQQQLAAARLAAAGRHSVQPAAAPQRPAPTNRFTAPPARKSDPDDQFEEF